MEMVKITRCLLQQFLHQSITGDVPVKSEQVDGTFDMLHVKNGMREVIEPFFHQVFIPEMVAKINKLHVVLKVVLSFGLINAKGE